MFPGFNSVRREEVEVVVSCLLKCLKNMFIANWIHQYKKAAELPLTIAIASYCNISAK